MRGYTCGVDPTYCSGGSLPVNAMLRSHIKKYHNSPEEAFKCCAADLVRQGYTKIGARDFAAPDGGPIRVLTKRSRFGGVLRGGKRGEAGGGGSPTRLQPYHRGGKCKSGLIGSY